MTLLRLGVAHPVYHATIDPATFGTHNRGKIKRSLAIVFNKGRS